MDKVKKYKKPIIIGVILLFLVVYLGIKTDSKSNALTLILDFGNGSKKTFYNYDKEEKSAWSALQQVAAVSKIDLQAGPGFTPKKIDGRTNGEENKKWELYVNSMKQIFSPIDIKVSIPDKVIYKFE